MFKRHTDRLDLKQNVIWSMREELKMSFTSTLLILFLNNFHYLTIILPIIVYSSDWFLAYLLWSL